MQVSDPLSNRTLSAYPLSVGTSLAFESIFVSTQPSIDPDRKIPQKITISDYNEMWINLSTLFRNAMGAMTKDSSGRVLPNSMKEVLQQEMETIEDLLRTDGRGTTKPVFYVCTYNHARDLHRYPGARLRMENTDKQKAYAFLHETSLQLVLNEAKSESVKLFDSDLKPVGTPKALIMTHVAYDLLSAKRFKTLDLLESHSGVLKKKSSWYTKYYNGKELVMLPFMDGLLQIFGDNEMYSPFDKKLRMEIVELARSCKWNFTTTRDKIIFDLDKLKNMLTQEIVKKLL